MSSTSLASANEHARQPAEELCRQMRTIRREMGEDLEGIDELTEQLVICFTPTVTFRSNVLRQVDQLSKGRVG
jgi:hypothetical protein